jgi:hypothetical protein
MQRSKHWRPGPDTGIALVALAIALGGVGYAATVRDTGGSQVINACVEPAGNQLIYSSSGTCSGGQQLITWNQQGPQGAPGANGVSPSPVIANNLAKTFKGHFFISTEIDKAGTYEFEGKVVEQANTANWTLKKTNTVTCGLYTGVPSSNVRTTVRQNVQSFVYGNGGFNPPSFYGTIDQTWVETVTNPPFAIAFACAEKYNASSALVKFTDPSLSVQDVSKAVLQSGSKLPKIK